VARIDSLLRLVTQQGADELRLGVEREPKMFARGAPKRLSVPATSEETLRILLGEIFSPELEAELRERGQVDTSYESAGLGKFRVKFSNGQTARFDVAFLHTAAHGEAEVGAGAAQPPARGPQPQAATQPKAAVPGRGTLPDASGLVGQAPPPSAAGARAERRPSHAPEPATGGELAPRAPRAALAPDSQPPAAGVFQPGGRASVERTAPGLQAHAPSAETPRRERTLPQEQEGLRPEPREKTLPGAHRDSLRPGAPAPELHGGAPDAANVSGELGPHPSRKLSSAPPARGSGRPSGLPQQPAGALTEWAHRAAALGASDLHLCEGEPVRVRVQGRLQRLEAEPPNDLPRLLDLNATARARLMRGESLDLGLEITELGRLRAHVYQTDAGLAAALRLLPAAAPSFSSLNMPLAFEDVIDLPHGLVLVCGAAGSGKSTTLAALAQQLLTRRSALLVTLEDPIEYALSPGPQSIVRRRQIGRDVADFPSGLRDALRADPEVLLVGEMRDAESISLALTAAETGHLVLASMHSGSSASAVERIVDAYPAGSKDQVRGQLAESLRAIIVQRLLPRARGAGRVPAIEVLRVTRAVATLIREGKTAQLPTVLQSSRREGMLALERSLADRVLSGEVKPEAAFAAANDPHTLQQFLDQRSP